MVCRVWGVAPLHQYQRWRGCGLPSVDVHICRVLVNVSYNVHTPGTPLESSGAWVFQRLSIWGCCGGIVERNWTETASVYSHIWLCLIIIDYLCGDRSKGPCKYIYIYNIIYKCHVCVWNIWKDVKLLTFVVSYFSVSWKQQIAGGQRGLAKLCPTKLFASIPGSTDWSSVCTCQVMITCCSGFASDFISILSWHPAKPRTGKSIRFSFHFCTVVAIWNFHTLNHLRSIALDPWGVDHLGSELELVAL